MIRPLLRAVTPHTSSSGWCTACGAPFRYGHAVPGPELEVFEVDDRLQKVKLVLAIDALCKIDFVDSVHLACSLVDQHFWDLKLGKILFGKMLYQIYCWRHDVRVDGRSLWTGATALEIWIQLEATLGHLYFFLGHFLTHLRLTLASGQLLGES